MRSFSYLTITGWSWLWWELQHQSFVGGDLAINSFLSKNDAAVLGYFHAESCKAKINLFRVMTPVQVRWQLDEQVASTAQMVVILAELVNSGSSLV